MKYTALIGGERIQIELDSDTPAEVRARIDGRSYSLQLTEVEPGVFWLNLDGRSVEIAIIPLEDRYGVRIGDHRLEIELLDRRALLGRSAQAVETGRVELRAPMPGKIVRVLIEEGDTVEAEQGLIVIEAMKMQNELRSPKAGIVRAVAVEEGATVNAGDLLAAVE